MRHPFIIIFLSALFLFVSSVFCFAAEFGYQGTHILTHGALEDLAKAFQKKYGIKVTVKGGGCSDGLAVIINDRYTMGGLCCPLNPKDARKHGLISHRVAIDMKAVIVNPKNPVKNLTLKQVSDIHKGNITKWKQVGIGFDKFDKEDRPIALVFRDHCRDMDEPVRKALGIKGAVAKKAIIVKTDQEIVKYVENFSSAIGVVSMVFAEKANVRIIDVDGISPIPENIGNGKYPIAGDLYIITKGIPAGLTRQFIDFVLSADGQAIIGKRFARIK
ncbi:MAG: substrate-binding domain-containing protein [Nitrospirota bacterium]